MTDSFSQVLPLLIIFIIGYALKRGNLLSESDGGSLLKVIFYVGLPALVFISVINTKLDSSFMQLFLLAPIVMLITASLLLLVKKFFLPTVDGKTFAVMVTGSIIMNTGFLIPFIGAGFGAEGIAKLAIIDAGNTFATFLIAYPLIVSMGSAKADRSLILQKILIAPAIWALVAALLFKAGSATPPEVIYSTFEIISRLVPPVILLALGLKFSPRIYKPRLIATSLLARFGVGALIGIAAIALFGLSGTTAAIVLIACLAPIGFNAITFAEIEKLDTRFASSVVSIGLVVGIVLTPLLVSLLS